MSHLLNRLTPRRGLLLIGLVSALALGGALVAQHFFGLRPCTLCHYQRIPHATLVVLGGLGGLLPLGLSTRRWLLAVGCLVALVGLGLAGWHVGVEQHWWAGTASCQAGGAQATSLADLRAQLAAGPAQPACDEITWSLFGLTMAGYNVLVFSALALLAGALAGGAPRPK
ncbi:disulfide bond formation protein B [Roseospirillum parvum]|uniref:Disulfide bond formation protein DsbB n=1 Tax=Roseospirillum parvum TaxID=83401 RepID=A0A1G7Z5X9_9PROT|nr:disulfide bond formation protein B [Roseospirillum parvum]SDH03995.1 disulfide bond formation protein DsbB [Roseospirillum parvum]